MSEIKLNRNHTNTNIIAHIHHKDYMESAGFKERDKCWYFCRDIGNSITLNITIPKIGIDDDLKIFTLDENVLQPYDYQYILSKEPNNKFAKKVKEKVESWMEYMKHKYILSGHNYGDYI